MTDKTLKLELNPAWNIPSMRAMYEASYSEAIYQAWYEWKHMSPAEKNSHKPVLMSRFMSRNGGASGYSRKTPPERAVRYAFEWVMVRTGESIEYSTLQKVIRKSRDYHAAIEKQ